jgi:hypothetical protein
MTLDFSLKMKERYRGEWSVANARELYVLSLVNLALPVVIERLKSRTGDTKVRVYLDKARIYAKLTGLGAGTSEFISRSYSGIMEAFDITVLVDDEPCCWVDATGVASVDELKPGLGYCAATWKLQKAKKYRVLDRTWFAFVINETGTVKFLRAGWLAYQLEAESPRVWLAKLYQDENMIACANPRNWLSREKFIKQLETRLKQHLIAKILG